LLLPIVECRTARRGTADFLLAAAIVLYMKRPRVLDLE
jgi:hypothetical protein